MAIYNEAINILMHRLRARLKQLRPGQSLVEFTILLPILLMMLSGLIEFGFLLNSYLDVIDAAREAARFAANDDPTDPSAEGSPSFNPPPYNFWHRAWQNARGSLATASDGRINWNQTNPKDCAGVKGDIVVSAFAILGNTVDKRFPLLDSDGASNCGNYQSKISNGDVNAILSGAATNSGFVLIEVYYEYQWQLGLPWITAFFPEIIGDMIGDDDGKCESGEDCKAPVLYAYTIMPNTYAEPTPTP